MIEYDQAEQGESPSHSELGVKVVGVGGAGANVLDRMALEGSDDAELLTLNTDVRALSTSVSGDKIQLGATLLKGMGAGGDPSLGKQAALEAVDEIREAVRGKGMVFICVGLGGGTGSGAAPEVCRIAREEGCFLVVFATMPFSFEGERRMSQARDALDVVGRYANAVITFENDRMGELIVPKDGVTQAFAAADKIISQSIRATMNLAFRPGIIRIGMDDLLAALQSKNSRCLFGYGVAKGDNRSHEAVEQALKCPLLDRGKLLEEARTVLVQVAGGETMTLYEVQLVMEEMSKHVGKETQILFGTGTDKRLGTSLSVTVISSISDPNAPQEDLEGESEAEAQAPVSLGMTPETPESPLAAATAYETASETETGTFELEYEPEPEPEPAPQMPVEPQAPAPQPEPPVSLENPSAEPAPPDEEVASPRNDSAVFEPLDEDEEESPPPMPQAEEAAPGYSPQPDPVSSAPASREAEVVEEGPSDLRNPIARAMEGGSGQAAEGAEFQAHSAPPAQQPVPAAPQSQEPGEETGRPEADHVEAVTDSSQKIRLTRMSGGNAQGGGAESATAAPAEPPALPPDENPENPEEMSEEAKQQQEMLQLEPVSGKGRFAKTDPTIVDGEDLDVPTFLRKGK